MNLIVLILLHLREVIIFAVFVRCGKDVAASVYPGICKDIPVCQRCISVITGHCPSCSNVGCISPHYPDFRYALKYRRAYTRTFLDRDVYTELIVYRIYAYENITFFAYYTFPPNLLVKFVDEIRFYIRGSTRQC